MKRILITGATGRVGSAIEALLPADIPVRLALRSIENADKNPAWAKREIVAFDMAKPESHADALNNVSHVFLMWPPVKVEFVYEFIKAAEGAGVEAIVFLSISLAKEIDFLPHRRIEKRLELSSMRYTFLRASYFMQNLDSIHRADIQELDELFIPAGDGLVNLVDVRDVAEVAVKALTEAGHEGKIYYLAGRDNLGFQEIAETLTEILGRKIRYSDPNILRFVHWMWKKRAYPFSLTLFMLVEYSLARFKFGTGTPSQISEILGKAPRSFHDYALAYQKAWA
jgi:uncharacterized protein YbjT (DUF2867 family)